MKSLQAQLWGLRANKRCIKQDCNTFIYHTNSKMIIKSILNVNVD